MSRTLIIIKPDAIKRKLIGKIISRLEDADLKITRMEMKQKNSEWFEEMYPHLEGEVYQKMREFITYTPLIGIVLEGPYAVERIRRMIGNTSSVLAAPGTIRGDFGSHPIRYNCVHASDSVDEVEKEIALFFDKETDFVHPH